MKKLIILLALLISINSVLGATIYGTIYNLNLEKVSNIKVEIDTEPKQLYISKNGSYAFNTPNGDYLIEASYFEDSILESYVKENISVKDDGTYVLDLILFPTIEEDETLLEDIEIEDILEEKPNYFYRFILFTLILIGVLAYIYVKFLVRVNWKEASTKEQKSEETKDNVFKKETLDYNDLSKILDIIKKEGGRTTQKEIRKQIPLSEAKISLMITELEHKGEVKRIKKGRGNIIILKE